jgi:hypothetical protein
MAFKRIASNLKLSQDAKILNENEEPIINSDGTILTSEITVTNLAGDTSKVLFKSLSIQGSVKDTSIQTPLNSTGVLSNAGFRADDFVLTLGSGSTGDTGFETGKTQVVFNDSDNISNTGGVVMKVADASGVKKTFKLDMLDKVELLEDSILEMKSTDTVKLLSDKLEIVQIIENADTLDKLQIKGEHGGNRIFQGIGERTRISEANIIASNNDIILSQFDKLELLGTNSKEDILTLYISGDTGNTVTTIKSQGAGQTACKANCLEQAAINGWGLNSPERLACLSECDKVKGGKRRKMITNDNGILNAQSDKLEYLGTNKVNDIFTLYMSGGTGNTVTETKSMVGNSYEQCMNDNCAQYGVNSSEYQSCRTSCQNMGAAWKKKKRSVDGGNTMWSDNLQFLAADKVEVYDTLYMSGDTGSTVTTVKSQGFGCVDFCTANYGTDTESQDYKDCITNCTGPNVASVNTKMGNFIGNGVYGDSLEVINSDNLEVYNVLRISGDTGSTVTTIKSQGAGQTACENACYDIPYASTQEVLNCVANCKPGVGWKDKKRSVNGGDIVQSDTFGLISADGIREDVVLYMSGGTGNTVTTVKSQNSAYADCIIDNCSQYGVNSSEYDACRTSCQNMGAGWKDRRKRTTDGGNTMWSDNLQFLAADNVEVYNTLRISGDTGTTVTTIKSQGGEDNCDNICGNIHEDINSDGYNGCVRRCKRGSVSNSKKILGSTDGLTGVRSDKVNIVESDSLYDAIKLYMSGDTGTTVTTVKSQGGGLADCQAACIGNGTPGDVFACQRICARTSVTATKVNSGNFDSDVVYSNEVEILNADSFDVYNVLRISGDTGSTVTTEKSISGNGDRAIRVWLARRKLGAIDASVQVTEDFGADSFNIINKIYLSGDTGSTITETKSIQSGCVDCMIPMGRGQRELINDNSGNDFWEIVKGVGVSEVYGITYSSTTGTVETIISTVAETELHNKSLKITDSLVSVPALKINTIAGGASVANLAITSDGTVISGTSGCNVCKYVESFLFTGDTVSTITHNLGNEDVQVQLKDSTGNLIIPNSVNNYTTNTVDIGVSITGTYRIIILG